MIARSSLTTTLFAALLACDILAASLPDTSGPNYNIGPYHPYRPIPHSPSRSKTCVVKANENGSDDSQSILNALHECNNGGRVVFSKNEKYIIGTALDMTFLNHIDIGKDNARLEKTG